jgi:hypothetical protein
MQNARLGFANGHRFHTEVRRHIGRGAVIDDGLPEHLPGSIFKLGPDQLESLAVQILKFQGGIVVRDIDVGVGDFQQLTERLAPTAGRGDSPFAPKVQGQRIPGDHAKPAAEGIASPVSMEIVKPRQRCPEHLLHDVVGVAVVSVGKDRHIRTWDGQTGRPLGPPLSRNNLGDSEWIGRVAFPPRDSRTLVTGDIAGHAVFWDSERARPSRAPLIHPPTHMIWGVAFTPDGRLLATCCDDGMVRLWDAATGQPCGKSLRHGAEQGYYTLALSPDGRELATGGKDMRVLRWDLLALKQIGTPLFSILQFT